jgi:sialic acid synthase SpsE
VSNPLTISVSPMAVIMGATYIEKHLTFERDYLKLEDFISALNPSEFITMVKMIRDVETFPDAFSKNYELSEREMNYRKYSKKVVLAEKDIPAGHTIKREDVVMLRTPEPYNELMDLEDVVGSVTKEPVSKYKIIKKEYLK